MKILKLKQSEPPFEGFWDAEDESQEALLKHFSNDNASIQMFELENTKLVAELHGWEIELGEVKYKKEENK